MSTDAYFAAIAAGDTARLRAMIEADRGLLGAKIAPPHAPERQRRCSGLHAAVYGGRLESARVLIEGGIEIDARNGSGRSALHDAIEFGGESLVALLLDSGARVDICAAAILGRPDRIRELLESDPALVDDRSTGLSPLGWASFGNRTETARLLIDRGARMDDGELLCAASVGHVEVGRLLIECGADADAPFGATGIAPIHVAAAMRYTDDSSRFVELLLDCGADVNRRAGDGRTALDIAASGAERESTGNAERRRRFSTLSMLLRRRGGRRGSSPG